MDRMFEKPSLEPRDSTHQSSSSCSSTDLHPRSSSTIQPSSTDHIHSELELVRQDPTLYQEVIHNWTEKVKTKLRSENRTKEFLCEVRRDIGHILVLKTFDTPHKRKAFIRSLVKEPSEEEGLVAWLQEAKPTNPNEPELEERDPAHGPATSQPLPALNTLLETSGGPSSSGTSSSIQGDSSGAPSMNMPSAGLFGQFNPNFSSLPFPNLQVGISSQFGIQVPGISVKNLPPASALPPALDPFLEFLTTQRGLPGFINAQTVPIPSIPELNPKPTTSSERSRANPEGPKRKPGRPLGSTKMAMIQRKREDRKRAEESRLLAAQAQQDIFPVPRSSEEQAQIEKEGSEIARGLLLASLQTSMDTTVGAEDSSKDGGDRTKESAIGKEVSEPETLEAPVIQSQKRVLRKRKSGAELISSIDNISDESTPSGHTENPSTTIQPQPTTRQAERSKIPRKSRQDHPPSEYLETELMIKGYMREDNRNASRSGRKKIQESEEPIVSVDCGKVIDEMVERVMKGKIEDIVMPPAKRRRRSMAGSTAQESEEDTTVTGESRQTSSGEAAAQAEETSPQGNQVVVDDIMRESSRSEDAGTAHAEEAAPEEIQVAASKVDNFDDVPSNGVGASERPKTARVVKMNQPKLQEEFTVPIASGSVSSLITEDASKKTESPEATHPSETKAVIPLKSQETVSEAVHNGPSHSAEPQGQYFNFAMQREKERLQKMYDEMRKKPLCQSFCPRPTSEATPEVSTPMVRSSSTSAPKTIDAPLASNFPILPIQAHSPIPPQTPSEPLEAVVMSSTITSEVSTSMVSSSSSSYAAPAVMAADAPVASNLVPFLVTATSSSELQEKNQAASGIVPPGRSVIHTTPAVPQLVPGMLTLSVGVALSYMLPSRTQSPHQDIPAHRELPKPIAHPGAISSQLPPCAALSKLPPLFTASSQATAPNLPPANFKVPIAVDPTKAFSPEHLEPTGNGIQTDISSLSTHGAYLDSTSTTSSAEPPLQQGLPAPESALNSESRTDNSTNSGANSSAALPTSSFQAAREISRLSVNQQNKHGANMTSSAAAPEASTSTVRSSSTSDGAPAFSTADAPLAPTETSSSGRQEKNREAFGISPPAPSVTHATSAKRHPEMLPLPAGVTPSEPPTAPPTAPPHYQGVPVHYVPLRSFTDHVTISAQLPPDATRQPPSYTTYSATSQAVNSNSPPGNSTALLANMQVHASVFAQTPAEPLEPTGNGIQVAVSSSSPDSVASGTLGISGNQQNDLEANAMVYTAASEVPTSMVPNSSNSYAAPAVSTAAAPCASTETSRQQKNQEASGMLSPRRSVPQTTPAIPHPGMFPLPSGSPRAPPHHPGVPVRQVPQGSFMHNGQFIPGSNFMHHLGDPRMYPNFAQHPVNMRHPMVPPPPYTATSRAAPFNLPPVHSTVPMAFAPMRAHFPVPPRPEVAAQWMAAHSMYQHQNKPVAQPQMTPKRARKPRARAAPRHDTVVSIPIARSPPAAVPVPPIGQMIVPQPEVYQNPQASAIRRVFNTMPHLDYPPKPSQDSSSNESMPRLEADGEEEEAVGDQPGPKDQSSPEAPPPKNSSYDEDLHKMICRDEAIHEALKNAPRAKSRILPLEDIIPSEEECPDLEFFTDFADRSQSFGEMNRCTVTCTEMFSSEFTNRVEKRGQQKVRFHKNEKFRKTLEGVKAVALFEMVMQDNLITILNEWPEARQEPKFQLFLRAHELTGHKAVFNNENEAEAEKNLVIRTLNYLSDLSREKNFGCNKVIAFLLYAIHKSVGCCYPVQGFRLIHQILETYIKPRDENIEFAEID
ncbi:hypothetical protein L3Y34_016150 [Caenorhabditis briggsae]|uniref:Uncharacterized protein n=1 Tax=Caenorhabditis briggsae TaxID=6238 RepID=A0AAE9DXD9_CAEBR|nr:hypothetical protein L3Y34_016150 [Caenorhabditis briggsae]